MLYNKYKISNDLELKIIVNLFYWDKSKLPTPTIRAAIEEAIITTMVTTIRLLIVTTTIRPIRTTTSVSVLHSNINSDYMFYGIYTVKY